MNETCFCCKAKFDAGKRGYRLRIFFSGHNDEGERHVRDINQPVCSKVCLRDYFKALSEDP
jgi:hypothetical protein